jgi:galactonate dehydratase
MKITDIKATLLEEGLGGDWILVQVFTDEGITGLGESFPSPAGQGNSVQTMIAGMKSFLDGEDPMNIDKLYNKMHSHLGRMGPSSGLAAIAVSGVEIALWDIAGKSVGVPVYRLLGGKHRDQIRVYADFHGGASDDPASFAARAEEVVSQGFSAIKFDIDLPRFSKDDGYSITVDNADVNYIRKLVRTVREAIGPEVDLAIDCHGAFDTLSAKKIAYALEEFHLFWLEEPVPSTNIDALAEIKASTRTPICTGENLYTRFQFRDLLEKQAVDIIEPDIQKTGGILEGKRIADLASTYYMSMAPHCVATPVGTMASVHLCASLANFLILEFHQVDFPWWQDLAKMDEPIVVNGCIRVPESPGLGIELNEAEVSRRLRSG